MNLTSLQHTVLAHLVARFQLTESSFLQDCELFKDLCLAFRGNILIIKQPVSFVPVVESRMLERLVTAELKERMECQAMVRLGGSRSYKLNLLYEERPGLQATKFEPKNILPSEDNPLKYSFFMV